MHEIANRDPFVGEIIRNKMYVDDCVDSYDDEKTAIQSLSRIRKILQGGNFVLHKFTSNSKEVMQELVGSSVSEKEFVFENEEITSTLGVKWIIPQDTFSFTVKKLKPSQGTKRSVLSELASLFDPIGILSPIITTAKILYQTVCKLSNKSWDDPIPIELLEQWENF